MLSSLRAKARFGLALLLMIGYCSLFALVDPQAVAAVTAAVAAAVMMTVLWTIIWVVVDSMFETSRTASVLSRQVQRQPCTPSSQLPTVHTNEFFYGWRRARLVFSQREQQLCFQALFKKESRFGMDAEARCLQGRIHPAPHPDCDCGFYAYLRMGSALLHNQAEVSDPLLKVALWVTLIEHEDGFRAKRQRVMEVHIINVCEKCDTRATLLTRRDDNVVVPCCTNCAPQDDNALVITPAIASRRLGIPVFWIEEWPVPIEEAQEADAELITPTIPDSPDEINWEDREE